MPLVLTVSVHDWVTISDADDMSTMAFRASDIHYLQKIKNENETWSLIVYICPANLQIKYMDAEEEAIQKIFGQLLGLAHKADMAHSCSDCSKGKEPKQPAE